MIHYRVITSTGYTLISVCFRCSVIKLAFSDSLLFHVIGESVPEVPAHVKDEVSRQNCRHQNRWYLGCFGDRPDGAVH